MPAACLLNIAENITYTLSVGHTGVHTQDLVYLPVKSDAADKGTM